MPLPRLLGTPLASLCDPRDAGAPLRGFGSGSYWRYRVGDYRILCGLRDGELVVLVIEIGHRRSIYRRG
ncbi:MAG: type II toxin-antitoxin system RelE/ParE family toxin [Defluviicoccus sp.]|nr:type II toxin-antitoxin system RelE/ParE family toxin [Defluviicoccus sp.]